jgi:glycolate oxidase iron-sulfur subunit
MTDLSATDRCVKCGLCLPHCPTFALTRNEADSPRGRISLMQAIGQPQAQYTAGLFRHLDQCLQCGACEAMCPSSVPFGQLMDSARVVIEPHRQRSTANRLMRHLALQLIASPRWTKTLAVLLKAHRKSGLQWLTGKAPGLPATVKRLNRLLPTAQAGNPQARNPLSEPQGGVNLFRGCAGSLFDQQTLNAARRLLQGVGYRVNIPEQQGCCGALHQHNGDPVTAARLVDSNRRAFSADNDPILVTASGCTAHLKKAKNRCDDEADDNFTHRCDDVLHFLCRQNRPKVRFQPFEETVAVHIPCTHRNALGQQQDILNILRWIPRIEPLVINPGGGCCGAAGSYMLSQPELSQRLREPLIDTLVHSDTRLLLSSNIGCALHLNAGLKERGSTIEVLHPVVLLERLLAGPDEHGT